MIRHCENAGADCKDMVVRVLDVALLVDSSPVQGARAMPR